MIESNLVRVIALVGCGGILAASPVRRISPIALQQLVRIHGVNWRRLSDVGQTYGAVCAFLTALALGGVVVSLLYQARDVKAAREQASRTFHHELLKTEMESPFYGCNGGSLGTNGRGWLIMIPCDEIALCICGSLIGRANTC
jgi:hypothetical protein